MQLNQNAITTLGKTAGYKVALAVAQRMSPKGIKAVQRLIQLESFLDGLFGTPPDEVPQALFGGLTLKDVRESMEQLRDARLARKNIWFVSITDPNPPPMGYDVASVGNLINLFATGVSYGPSTITGEKVAIGSAMMDKITGTEAVEIQITTMDDEAGTLKRWFDGKCAQIAHSDGTFGLPSEFCVEIEVVHAVASPDAPMIGVPYSYKGMMRPVSVTHELDRREQAMFEMQMTFTQFDTFYPVAT